MKTNEQSYPTLHVHVLPFGVTAAWQKGDGNIIDFVSSTAALDRYQEEPDGWKLDRYRQNQVFLNSHRSVLNAHRRFVLG